MINCRKQLKCYKWAKERWRIMCYNISNEPADIIIHVQGKDTDK